MKLFFITTNYTVYLSFLLLIISTTAMSAQANNTAENDQIAQTTLQITRTAIELEKNRVAITWTTQGESDLDLFVIQRSLDGKQWEQLVAIAATGNTEQQQIYQTTDSQPYEGTSYYRIGQFNFSAEEAYTTPTEILYEVPMERFFSVQHTNDNY
ncbi:MAG: hypothetical protein AB8G22_01415 [Saprospiraceae bacterium]